ncbi:response regulator transcription factor [Candidatus Poribacteria bacterium]|nr:response regulator transcription factor [Candidatus Poribacteria bacterium]
MKPYRIVLADDHALLRQGIIRIVRELEDVVIVGETGDGVTLLELVKKTVPDMAILDISMPRLGGIEAAREIRNTFPEIKTLILTMHKEKEYLYHALAAGVAGYLLKEDTHTELFTAIEQIRRGTMYLSPCFLNELTDDVINTCGSDNESCSDCLTPREREVLKHVAEGKSSKEIADVLFISSRTVEHHRASIARRLGITSLADLVKYAIRKGYIAAPD